jgi:hypothetical protein
MATVICTNFKVTFFSSLLPKKAPRKAASVAKRIKVELAFISDSFMLLA